MLETLPNWVVTTLKWTLAIVGMVIVVAVATPRALDHLSQAITFGNDDDDLITDPTPTPPDAEPATSSGEGSAHTVVGVRNAVIHTRDTDTVTLSPDGADELLIAFEALPADPACLTNVELEVQLIEATETEVLVRPARVADLAALEEGEPLPADASVDGGSPSRAFTSGAPGRLRWNATIPYSLAAREAEAGGDVVLSVFLPAGSDAVTTFATGMADDAIAATLAWTGVAGCEALDPTGEAMGGET